MRNFIRRKLRSWLGILLVEETVGLNKAAVLSLEKLYSDLVSIGVDVHFTKPHMILIYSKINGGQLRHIDAHFDNLKELNEFCHHLREKYNTKMQTNDIPPGLPRGWL